MKLFKELIDNPRQILRLHGISAVIFFVGMGSVLWAENSVEPSLQQELIALLGVGLVGLGFTSALLAQIALIISRIKGPSEPS